MKTSEWKQLIQDDVECIKHLDLEILPSGVFYTQVLKMMLSLYAIIVGIPFLLLMALSNGEGITVEFYYADLIYLSILFGVISLFALPKMGQYITFKQTIKPYLKLGQQIDAKFKFLFRAFAITYSLWVLIYTHWFFSADFSHFGERMFTVLVGFVLSIFITSILFEMEVARVGFAALFESIAGFRKKEGRNA